MSAKAVSYALLAREAAGELDLQRDEHKWATEARQSFVVLSSGLRALAALVEEAEKIEVVNGIMWGDVRALVIALQAGYTPPEGQK